MMRAWLREVILLERRKNWITMTAGARLNAQRISEVMRTSAPRRLPHITRGLHGASKAVSTSVTSAFNLRLWDEAS
jgi:hypothetical protein